MEEVAVGIRTVVRKLVSDGFDAVIEGAHFHSGIIEDLRVTNGDAEVQATLLIVRTVEELRQLVNDKEGRRAQRADRKRWLEALAGKHSGHACNTRLSDF